MSSPVVPPKPRPKNFIKFTFNNGNAISSSKVEVIKDLVEFLESTPTVNKKNAYFVIENKIVFLENVDSISWNLVEEEPE